MKQDLDISNIESKPTAPKRDRIRIERKKYDQMLFDLKMAQTALDNRNKEIDGWVKQNNELRAERDKYKESAEINGKAAHDMLRDYEKVLLDIGKITAERDALNVELSDLRNRIKADEQNANDRVNNWEDNYVWATKQMSKLRYQRDTARFLAALLLIVSVGFAVAVWIGKLVPNLNLD